MLLEKFGIDLGYMGQEIYEWLWPKRSSNTVAKHKGKLDSVNQGGYLPRTNRRTSEHLSDAVLRSTAAEYNYNLHRYLLHNYAQETVVDIYRRIAFHMRISPRVLAREVAALTGRFGINILQPDKDEYGKTIQADILCLRRVKAKIYSLLGRKLLKYHMLLFLRYIKLGIPPEIRERYVSDILTRTNISHVCEMFCGNVEHSQMILPQDRKFSIKQEAAKTLTYPERVDFDSQGYPYSAEVFSLADVGSSPSQLVHPKVYKYLNKRSRSKLVYIFAALNPQCGLQIIKHIVSSAGYKCERDLLLNFCLGSNFGSRGAKAFVSKLKEERISDHYISKAAQLATGGKMHYCVSDALVILQDSPYVSGLIKRHIDSGRKVMPISTARMIFKRIRNNVELQPQDMTLWDVMRKFIALRVPNAPLHLYKQVRMEIFANETYISPNLKRCLKRRGIEADGITELYTTQRGNTQDVDYSTRSRAAKVIRRDLRQLWISAANSSKIEMERIGLDIIDAMVAAAGYGTLNNLIVLVTMLSKLPDDNNERRCRQPGPDFEHSPLLEMKDFKFKKFQDYSTIPDS
ncbi:uncharacterized protein BXIN_1586 [Babesia sp. Xinjiang]|uniref:uncharacterized protein n=1 Tax=Babesia sp. Xinjiang TaxID=462227 RepID=UPI000A24548A|nr:uncharacterized protein BXIN_1586 [Babesia sp. Xinjiang]ORM42334.1 hypothetical protein BXIN_1586 [Babesia sp. Xinjiang]